jgi:hypothetical protein
MIETPDPLSDVIYITLRFREWSTALGTFLQSERLKLDAGLRGNGKKRDPVGIRFQRLWCKFEVEP